MSNDTVSPSDLVKSFITTIGAFAISAPLSVRCAFSIRFLATQDFAIVELNIAPPKCFLANGEPKGILVEAMIATPR